MATDDLGQPISSAYNNGGVSKDKLGQPISSAYSDDPFQDSSSYINQVQPSETIIRSSSGGRSSRGSISNKQSIVTDSLGQPISSIYSEPKTALELAQRELSDKKVSQISIQGKTYIRNPQGEVIIKPIRTRVSGGSIRGSTQQERKALSKQENVISQLGSSVWQGFTFSSSMFDRSKGTANQNIKNVQDVGNIFGFIGGVATLGQAPTVAQVGKTGIAKTSQLAQAASKAAKASKVGKTIGGISAKTSQVIMNIPGAQKATQIATQTKGGQFATNLLQTAGRTYLIGQGVSSAGSVITKETAPEDQKKLLKDPKFQKLVSKALAAEREEIVNKGGLVIPGTDKAISPSAIANDLSLFIGGKKSTYYESIRESAKEQGLSPTETAVYLEAAERERKGRGYSEIGSFIATSASVEAGGRKSVQILTEGSKIPTKKLTVEGFKTGFKAIAPLGIIEGTVQEQQQQKIRGQQTNLKEIGLTGVYGGLSAGLLGGAIFGLAPLNPGKSKALEVGAYIVDPYEKPGDIVADIAIRTKSKITGRKVPTLSLTLPTDTEIASFSTTQQKTKEKTKKPSQIKRTSNIFTQFNTYGYTEITGKNGVLGYSSAFTLTPTPADFIGGVSQPGAIIPADTPPGKSSTPSETPTKPSTPITPITDTPISIYNLTSETPVQTSTSVNTVINLPTATPIMRIPPVMFPGLSLGGGGGARIRKGQGKILVNELAIGSNLLNNLISGPQKKVKYTKSKAKKSKNKTNNPGKSTVNNALSKMIWG